MRQECVQSWKGVKHQLDFDIEVVATLHWQEEKNLVRRKGPGRPRKTGTAADRDLVVLAKRNRFESIPRLFVSWSSAAGVNCSVRTAYRRLAEAGLKFCRPAVGIPLSKQ